MAASAFAMTALRVGQTANGRPYDRDAARQQRALLPGFKTYTRPVS